VTRELKSKLKIKKIKMMKTYRMNLMINNKMSYRNRMMAGMMMMEK